uniref:Adaptor protein, phosphotyrosine interacting with PH domain and leucine zipper 2 n=1 Tax=Takifugu rubripes TaxID=31033 RepID=A0A674NNS9_TAKRU
MPAVHHKLLLEEALQDSPQTRSLLSVFEEDSGMLTNYTNQLLQALQRVFGAQSEMGLATEQLSQQLLEYEKKNFALGKGDEEVISTLQNFAKSVGEVRPVSAALLVYVFIPVGSRKGGGGVMKSLQRALYHHEAAMVKYSRLPKKKENEKVEYMMKEVAYTRRKLHQASLQYYCALNALQYRKRIAMLEPMLGYTLAQIGFFKKGIELVSKKMDSFLNSNNIEQQLKLKCAEAMRVTHKELLSGDDTVYMPDRDTEPVNRTLIQKAGYLNIRNKTGLVTTAWDRLFFFTQGGNLMCQPRGAVAGGMVLDLDNSSVMAIDCEDRRYCFQITSPSGKTSMILQAESKKEYEEWICTVNNISRQIYLTDNPEAVAIRLNQTAIEAVTPITSFEKRPEGSPNPDRAKPGGLHTSSGGSQTGAALEPEDLIAPGTPIQFDIMLPASEFQDQNRAGGRRTNPFGETDDECSAETDDSLLQQVFAVRFLGSMAVRCGKNQEVIYEAMRQVLAARAIHNIFRTTESHLMVTSSNLSYPQYISYIAAHELMREATAHGRILNCSLCLPSQICYTISLAKDITEAKKDPEALAQLMKNMPLTNDGKFLLLDTETGNHSNGEGNEDLESEA